MFIVTLPKSAASNPRLFSLRAKKEGADILEIRGDITPAVSAFVSSLPLLVAPRGKGTSFIHRFDAAYVDLEISEHRLISKIPSNSKIILSVHEYKKTPDLASIKKIVQKLYTLRPWMIKISTAISREQDILTLWKLQDFLNKKSIRSTVLGMGQKAHILRITSPVRNALTYTFLDGTDPSAPGQLPLSFYRTTSGRKHPKLLGIIGGSQITASLSPLIHNALFQRHKIDALYSCFPTDNFTSTIKVLQKIGVQGFSVTAPFKKEAFQLEKKHDALVDQLGVANTLVRSPFPPRGKGLGMGEGEVGWQAFNTDVFGIQKGYPQLKKAISIAILGAGGAVPSAILAIRQLNPKAQVTAFVRDMKKAKKSLENVVETQDFASLRIQNLTQASQYEADAVICAISDDVRVPLPKPLSKTSIAIDLRYGKITAFMKDAKKKGYRVQDGIPMLIHQALKQFEHFTGKRAKTADVLFLQRLLKSYHS